MLKLKLNAAGLTYSRAQRAAIAKHRLRFLAITLRLTGADGHTSSFTVKVRI